MKDVDIMIFGASRCGKTTLSRMLAERFGYPVIHTDAVTFALQEVYSLSGPGSWPAELDGRSLYIHRYLRYQKFIDWFSTRYILEGNVSPLDILYFFHPEKNITFVLGMTETSNEEIFDGIRKNDQVGDITFQQTDAQLSRYISGIVARSKRNRELCQKHHIPFIETGRDREAVLASVVNEIERRLTEIDNL